MLRKDTVKLPEQAKEREKSQKPRWGAQAEVTKGHVKKAEKGGRTPWDILDGVYEGNERDIELFRDYAQGTWNRTLFHVRAAETVSVALTLPGPEDDFRVETRHRAELVPTTILSDLFLSPGVVGRSPYIRLTIAGDKAFLRDQIEDEATIAHRVRKVCYTFTSVSGVEPSDFQLNIQANAFEPERIVPMRLHLIVPINQDPIDDDLRLIALALLDLIDENVVGLLTNDFEIRAKWCNAEALKQFSKAFRHLKGDRIQYTQAKGGKTLWLPAAPQLVSAIRAMKLTGTETFIVNEYGKPFTKAGIGNKMREWCDQAGLPHCASHGLRKAAARRAADLEATNQQLKAAGGWSQDQEVSTYTAAANQAKLATDIILRVSEWELSNPLV